MLDYLLSSVLIMLFYKNMDYDSSGNLDGTQMELYEGGRSGSESTHEIKIISCKKIHAKYMLPINANKAMRFPKK